MVYVTEPIYGVSVNFSDWQAGKEMSLSCVGPRQASEVKFPYLLKLPSSSLEWLSFSLVSPCCVCVNQHLVLEEHKLGHSTLP